MTQPGNESWADVSIGGTVLLPGSTERNLTGSWRTFRPVWDEEKCSHCMTCWILCPDDSILVEDGKVVGIDYDHCKGCGICAAECPPKIQAFEMKRESDFRE